jgi:hypothetical protein
MPEFDGTWRLMSRIDRARDGNLREEPSLGSDPVAMITSPLATLRRSS